MASSGVPPPLLQHPQLPVRADALYLPVRAKLRFAAGAHDVLDRPRQFKVVEVIFGSHQAAARARINDAARREAQQSLVLPDVGLLIPVVLAPYAAVADNQRRRIADAASGKQGHEVFVERRDGDGVFNACVPVEDLRDVIKERRAALRHIHHLQVTRRLDQLLALIAARLVVALDAMCACTSIKPGIIVLPAISMRSTPAGTATLAPTALMRLSSMRMAPRSMTSSPFMVISRALVSATCPRGRAVSKAKPMRVCRGSGAFSSTVSCLKMFSKDCS